MAIVFDKALSETDLLNSHNNNTVEFHSDSVLTAVKCTLDFGSTSFEITPSPTGQFDYNLRHASKTLINASNFIDSIIPDIESNGYSYLDSSLYRLITLIYTITFDNETTETTTKNYRFTKSVKQPERYDETIISATVDRIGILLPFVDYSVKSHAATYFIGYPFDIPIFSDIARTVTVRNVTNSMTYDLALSQGVNRLFMSDGSNNFSFDDELPMMLGINQLEFDTGFGQIVTLYLNKKESQCGRYLRWYSSTGGYSYFLFDEIYSINESTKIIDQLQSNFKSIEEASDMDGMTGKRSQSMLNLFSEYLSSDDMNYLKTIIDSPRVELYVQEVFTKAKSNSWRGVTMSDGTHTTEDTKRRLKRMELQVGYTNHVMTL